MEKVRTLTTPDQCKAQIQTVLSKFNNYSEVDNDNRFREIIGLKMRERRLALGLTQTKVSRMLHVTFQQGQKYEKGTNSISFVNLVKFTELTDTDLLWFLEDFSEYLINLEKSKEGHMNVNYNFLTKLYSELNADQKLKFNKSLQFSSNNISKVG
jgi:transcriptional regulator with XRE-family HTH domain